MKYKAKKDDVFLQFGLTVLFIAGSFIWVAPSASGATGAKGDPTARALEAYKASTSPEEVERLFEAFCLSHYGAEKEPLIYDLFGSDLKFIPKGEWAYVSRNSACVAWETNLPARCYVEYGPTTTYGRKTVPTKRFYYVHLQYLKDLTPGQAVHYRIIATDERGNKIVSKDKTFTPKKMPDAIMLPAGDGNGPYILDKAGATYLLSKDVACPKSAFEIKADNITLDLGGHTVVYHNEPLDTAVFTDKWMSYIRNGTFGIKAIGITGLKVLNGVIKEGAPEGRGNNDSTGFNPIYLRECSHVSIMGVQVVYHSAQTSGLQTRFMGDDLTAAYCVFNDLGTKMQNRHGTGCSTNGLIAPKGKGRAFYNNLIKRTRQNGLRGSEDLHNNEIYVDSWATNSFASGSVREKGVIRDNRIFGTGYHVIAIPWGDGLTVKNNLVHMEGINTGKTRWWEGFGDQNSMNGLRHTQWGKNKTPSNNSCYSDNLVIVNLQNGAQGRGVEFFADTYIKGLTLKNSIIKVCSLDELTTKGTCMVTHGSAGRNDTHNPVTYENVKFISNINNMRLGDYYGRGDNHQLFGCTFVKTGNRPDYHTVVAQSSYWSRNHILQDCKVEGGARLDDVDWGETKPDTRDYYVKWTLKLQTFSEATVQIKDKKGNVEFEGKAGKDGSLTVPLTQFYMSHKGKDIRTPHTVLVKNGDETKNKTVEMIQPTTINLK